MMKKMGDEVLEECMKERYGLAKGRIREIITEETVKKPFGDFFRNRAKFLSMAADVMDESAAELYDGGVEREKSLLFIRISSRKIMKAAMEIRRMQYSRWENMEKPSVFCMQRSQEL